MNAKAIGIVLLCLGCVEVEAMADPGKAADNFFRDVRFPAGAGVVNVCSAPYNAKGDGVTDDTVAIQTAILDQMKGGMLYFPNGTYLISDTIKWSKKSAKGEECWGNLTIQGQSTTGAVLRLKDGIFTDRTRPKSMMWCGGFGSADWFHNYVKNLTFHVGTGNPGAIGLEFYSNNTGAVRDVEIVSGDGGGVTGLEFGHRDMNGPLLVSGVVIRGFETGIRTGHSVNSQVFEHIYLQGQAVCGLHNDGQALSVRGLRVEGAPVAVRNAGEGGFLTLIDSVMTRREPSSGAAIENAGGLFARNVRTRGYGVACRTTRGSIGPVEEIDEFVSEPVLRLFDSPGHSLGLPVEETPNPPWELPEQWVNAQRFHAGGEDYSAAIQAAIDSGARTVYFPFGTYAIGKTVVVRGKVQRLVGLNSWFGESAPGADVASARFRVADGESPVVVMEGFRGGFGGRPFVEYTGARTLVLKEAEGVPSVFRGTGKVFLEDVTGSPAGVFVFEGPQRVWARQFNVEAHVSPRIHVTVENSGGRLWILGLKTEQGNRLVATRQGGETEILGGLIYTVTSHEGRPAFIIEDASMSMTLLERCFTGMPMDPVVQETRQGVTRTLPQTSVIGLYTGYR